MRKILVAFDGSEMSKSAIQEAKCQAERNPDIQIHVVSVVTMSGPIMNYVIARSIMEEIADSMRSEMKQLKEELAEEGMNTHFELIVDYNQRNPGVKVCQYAKENDIELIIVGSRGLGVMSGLLLGSVSHYIVQHASCNVLIIK